MNELALSAIELFSGVGMLGEGVRAGLAHMGIGYRTCVHVEREAHAAAVLVARMEEGSLDAAPIWSDVTTFNARAWRGKVDCVVAGFPCQDLSVAGRRAGLDGKRSGLFFEVTRIADDSDAWLIVLENVAGIASATATVMDEEEGELDERAAARVVGELADLGWNAEWIVVSAADVGGNHVRERWFCLAWRDVADSECAERRAQRVGRAGGQQGHDGRRAEEDGRSGIASEVLGDPGLQFGHLQQRAIRPEPARAISNVADSIGTGRQGSEFGRACNRNWGGQEAYGSVSEFCGLFAPGPSDARWRDILDEFPEVAPALEPTFRSVVNGLAFDMGDSRAARLKCVGNGVVALSAAVAFVVLARRAGIFKETSRLGRI